MAQPIWNQSTKHYSFEENSDPKDRVEVEVGDAADSDNFHPQVKIKRWNNEVNSSIRLVHDGIGGTASYSDDGDVITWSKGQWEAKFYHRDDLESGGIEFEVHIPVAPPQNYLEFSVNTKDLDWFYQPALTQDEIDEGAVRPDNVVGSYAVYHKTKGGTNDIAGMDYKVGKAFHMYRPHVVDSDSNETWGELTLNEQTGILTITVDQTWLDNAVYPVIVDPTVGYTSIGGSNIGSSDDSAYGVKYYLGGAGDVSKITMYVGGNACDGKGLIFDDSSDYPGNLEGTTDVSALSFTASWQDLDYSTEPSLSAGYYWIGWVVEPSNFPNYYYDTGSTNQRYISPNTGEYATPPDPFPASGTGSDRKVSIYATYATASPSWYDNDWGYRVKVTVDGTKVIDDLSDDAWYIDLSNMPSGFFTNVQSGGGDIRLTKADGTTELPREVVDCNTGSSVGEVWFKYIDVLSSSSDTDVYVYYGNGGASDYASNASYGSENVWTKDYMGVWHMRPSGATIINSTGNTNTNMLVYGSVVTTTGQIGFGMSKASGASNYMRVPDHAEIQNSAKMTLAMWGKYTANTVVQARKDDGGANREYYMEASRASSGEIRWTVRTGGTFQSVESTDTTPANGSFHHLVGILNDADDKRYFYVDGSEDAASPSSAQSGTISDTSADLYFAARSGSHATPDVVLDEVKLLDSDWNDAEVETHYNNEKANDTWFKTWGSPESGGGGGDPAPVTGYLTLTSKMWGT